jgi:hypothetical protein
MQAWIAEPDRRKIMHNQTKKSINGKKLSLSKETLRQLSNKDLGEVAGGMRTKNCPDGPTAVTCTSGPSWPCPR